MKTTALKQDNTRLRTEIPDLFLGTINPQHNPIKKYHFRDMTEVTTIAITPRTYLLVAIK